MVDETGHEFPGAPKHDRRAPVHDIHALHRHDIEELRAVIAELLQQVEFLQRKKHTSEREQSQLREANQNLVLATFGAEDRQAAAEDRQATAEATNLRQTEFLSMLAHELRNPLQPIAMANELLGKLTIGGPELLKFHQIIGRQVAHLARLVDDLFDASRVSSGKISLHKAPLILADVIAAAVETSRPFIEARRQRITLAMPAQPVLLSGDLVRLAQVFSNLLINASKFSPESERIDIEAAVLARTVRVVVRDHGIGIAAELQPFIFDLFTQGLRSADRAQGGLGIGLSLANSILEMHGGSITVASEGVGLGSAFTVLLPLAIEPAAPAEAAPPAASRRRQQRILLVEDNIDANENLCQLLVRANHVVTQRFNGVTALASATARPYDVVICDIGLPGMDGYALVAQIRAAARWAIPTFVATSGYNEANDQERARQSGFDHYLVKPFDIGELLALIDRHQPAVSAHRDHP